MPFMLNNIRGALKGVVAWMFAIVGIAAFSVVGVPELQSFTQKPAIKAGNIVIDQNEVLEAFNLAVRQQQAGANRAFTREEALSNGLPNQIVSGLRSSAALQLEAQKLNLAMPRSLIREILNRNPNFQNPTTGQFDQTVLDQLLRGLQLNPSQFEELMRRDNIQNNLVSALQGSSTPARALVDVHLARQKERRNISWFSVTEPIAGTAIEPTEQDLQKWYDDNPARYTTPELRKFTFVYVRNADFRDGITIPEEDLRASYDANKGRLYDNPEKRTLYQLTLPTRAEAQVALDRLRNGTPFETLVIENGTTLAAATLSQALKSDIVDEAVAGAAFADTAVAGAILDPIEGLFGTTIIQIVEIEPATSQSFEEVRDEIETAFLDQKNQRKVYDVLELVQQGLDDELPLAQAATNAGISSIEVGPVDRFSFGPGGEIIDDIPGVALSEGFSLEEGDDPEALELADNAGYVFILVNEIIEPALKPFEDVSQDVETAWRNNESRDRISKKADAIAEQVKAGASLTDIAAEFERAPITESIDLVNTNHDTISAPFHQELFSAEKGAVLVGGARGGNVKIVAIINDIDFIRGSINPVQFQNFGQFVSRQLDQELIEAYVATLQQDYKVEVNQPLIDRLFSIEEF